VFFRAKNLGDVFYVISNCFDGLKWFHSEFLLSQENDEIIVTITALTLIAASKYTVTMHNKSGIEGYIFEKPMCIRWMYYYALIYAVIFLGISNSTKAFIYLQF